MYSLYDYRPGFITGKGLFAERKFPAGSFLLEYHGELISKEEGIKRENTYPVENGSFLLYFKSGRTEMWYLLTCFSERRITHLER